MKKWINVIKNYRQRGGLDCLDPRKKSTVICELYFAEHETRKSLGTGRKTLVSDAIPSIFKVQKLESPVTRKPLFVFRKY